MEYCVYEQDIANNKKLVKSISSTHAFIDEMKCKYNAEILKNISKDAILANDFFKPGFYLLIDGNLVELVDKTVKMDTLFIWQVLPYEESNIRKQLQISEFKLGNMCANPSILIIGKRGTGVTWLSSDILNSLGIHNNTTIISPTDKMNNEYLEKFPNATIHYDMTEDNLRRVLLTQDILTYQHKKNKDINPSGMLLMDNCLGPKKSWEKIHAIPEILMNARHYSLSYILTMQSPMGLPPDLRLNFDYIFLLKENSEIARKKIWMNYASMFENFETFEKVFSNATENFSSMVIDNRNQSNKLSDQVYWYNPLPWKRVLAPEGYKANQVVSQNISNPVSKIANEIKPSVTLKTNCFFETHKLSRKSEQELDKLSNILDSDNELDPNLYSESDNESDSDSEIDIISEKCRRRATVKRYI